MSDKKKASKKRTHSETYSNETYRYVKEGRHDHDSQGRKRVPAGKGDSNRISNYEEFRDNFDDIEW